MATQDVQELDARSVAELAEIVGAGDSKTKALVRAALNKVADDEKLTPEERDELRKLEAKFEGGQHESIVALRAIRERKLFREDHKTFDDYVERRWNRTRQWATQQINWLRRSELLEANGKDPYQMTVDDAQALAPLEEHPELFVEAIAEADEEARLSGKKRTKNHIKEAVRRRIDFVAARAALGMPDLAYDESRALARLGVSRMVSPDLAAEAKEKVAMQGSPLSDCLLEVCRSHHAFPSDRQLLGLARGADLDALVQPLAAARAHWDEIEELQEKRRKKEQELEEIEEQIAPPGSAAQSLAPEPSDAVAFEDEEEEERDEEPEDEPGRAYRILLSGTFERVATSCVHGGGPEMFVEADAFPELRSIFAEKLAEGFAIDEESSITVVPLTDEDADDEGPGDTANEEVEDEGDAGAR